MLVNTTRSVKSDDIFVYLLGSVYIFSTLYITLLTRLPSLTPKMTAEALWSYIEFINGDISYGREIFLNILLFVPIGYFLVSVVDIFGKRKYFITIIACILFSVVIEAIQYRFHLGLFDVDDLISNTAGAVIGLILRNLVSGKSHLVACLSFVLAGIVGCIIASPHGNVDGFYIKQFDFHITNISNENGFITIHGDCSIYEQDNELKYNIILIDTIKKQDITAKTQITDNHFVASAPINSDDRYAVYVQFSGYRPIKTLTYIHGETIEYVETELPALKVQCPDVEALLSEGTLKAYNHEYDTYVYQIENRLYWVIGTDLNEGTEVIYQIHTSNPDKLPEERRKYKFDNNGFFVGKEIKSSNERYCGKYLIYEREIPDDYPVVAICVGYSESGRIKWSAYFRL